MTVFVVAVFFCATLIRSALGFGEALVAVPLIAFVLPVEIAAPVAVLVSITVAAVTESGSFAADATTRAYGGTESSS